MMIWNNFVFVVKNDNSFVNTTIASVTTQLSEYKAKYDH